MQVPPNSPEDKPADKAAELPDGVTRAAIVLNTLPEIDRDNILKRMPVDQQIKVRAAMTKLHEVDPLVMEGVLEAFVNQSEPSHDSAPTTRIKYEI